MCILQVVLDRSGIYVATSCTNKSLSVYDYYSGECMATMYGHSELVTGLRYFFILGLLLHIFVSQTKTQLFSARNVISYNIMYGALKYAYIYIFKNNIMLYTNNLFNLFDCKFVILSRFTADCQHLISASGDGCIFVWRVPHDMVVTMRARLAQQAIRQGRSVPSK